jgi:Uma2 family endonuclease
MKTLLLDEVMTERESPHIVSGAKILPRPRRMMSHLLERLGNIPADRVRLDPPPGTATLEDVIAVNEHECLCELIDGTLVEKAVGNRQGFFAAVLISSLWPFVRQHKLGIVVAPDGMFTMINGNIREPDVSYTRRDRLPNPFPNLGGWCPDLCVEILSDSNTRAEMRRKRSEYFASGCRLVWEFEPKTMTVDVFTAVEDGARLTRGDMLDGGDVLPGFAMNLSEIFDEMQEPFSGSTSAEGA